MKRRQILFWCLAASLGGCSSINPFSVRSQSPDEPGETPDKPRLVGDIAVPFGMYPIRVEAVGLVSGLRSTGSDPAPSVQRAALINEMQRRNVERPNEVLASPSTALVLIQGLLRPGIQKGDKFDIEVRVPSRSEATSLRGGWLLETRLKELAVLGNRVREGHLLALADGPVMIDPSADPENDQVASCHGRILGGGVALKSRSLGLMLKSDHRNVLNSSRIAVAINQRFHTFDAGVKTGVAKAKTDKFVELIVHPRYKDNIQRYVNVIRSVAMRETTASRRQRLNTLEEELLNPVTSAAAALELEAIGSHGVDVLLRGIESSDPEVRFRAAEALAYLDRSEAAEPLGELARSEPAFRVFALTALGAMDDFGAYEQLCSLLSVPSAETRYGAFLALWQMRPNDPLVLGEQLGKQFSYHVLNTSGPAMVHVARNRRPEIVLFGEQQHLLTPLAVNAGNQIMVTTEGPGQVAVSKYAVGEPDQRRVVSTKLDDVIRAIVELGGTYPDVVQALQEAKAAGALASRFEVDAVPKASRTYHRVADDGPGDTDSLDEGGAASENASREKSHPKSGLFPFAKADSNEKSRSEPVDPDDSDGKSHPLKTFFAKMVGRNPE